jgi:energy-coupling factor transport system permease protein
MFNARAWLIWLAAALAVAMLATNPLYLVIVLLCAALVRASFGTGSSLPVWRFGLTVVAFSTFYNALLTHFGDTVVFTLPRALPLVGGSTTLEAAAFGASRGLALWTLFAVFAVLNDVLSPYELVRLTPRFLREAGLVISITLAFVPQTVRSFSQVREAQAIRGHQLRGVRDLTALIVPLLADSLEKAVQLAEAMEARGYGQISNLTSQTPALPTGSLWPRASASVSSGNTKSVIRTLDAKSTILMAGGLSGVLIGWLAEAYWRNGAGWAIIGASVIALVLGVRALAAHTPRTTRYKPQAWSARDSGLVVLSLAPLCAIAFVALLDPQVLTFYPYPRVMLPPFDARLGLCLALLGAPVFMRFSRPSVSQATATAGK